MEDYELPKVDDMIPVIYKGREVQTRVTRIDHDCKQVVTEVVDGELDGEIVYVPFRNLS